MLERFDREFAHGPYHAFHEGYLESEAIPDGRKGTFMAGHLTSERIALGKGRIEFCPDPQKAACRLLRPHEGEGMTDLLNDFINEIATDSVNAKLEYVCVDCGGKGW